MSGGAQPEIFQNCANIVIGSGGSPPPPTAPAPAPAPAPVTSPTSSGGGACCSGRASGLAAANSCSGFVHCSGGSQVGSFIACPSGLKFNQGGQYCDWPSNVNCASSCSAGRRLRGDAIDEGVNVDGFDVDGGEFDAAAADPHEVAEVAEHNVE